jgi:hypothetical protein
MCYIVKPKGLKVWDAMNNQRKQFTKAKRDYEKLLKIKAKLGTLSLPEKEQYQSMRHSQKRNNFIRGQQVLGTIVTCGIGITMAILFYIGPRMQQVNAGSKKASAEVTTIQGQRTTSPSKKQIAEKVEKCIAINSKANQYFNQGVEEYNDDKRVGISHVENLQALYDLKEMTEFKTLNALFTFKLDKQIDILARLEDPKEDKEALQKEVEEIVKLEQVYKQAVYDILDREEISYK